MESSINEQSASKLSYLALGDSYTIGECVGEDERWPVQLVTNINAAGALSFDAPKIIAKTGWRTDELIQAIEEANITETFNLVSLLIGVNNQYQGIDIEVYRQQFNELLQKSIGLASHIQQHVLVVSIPDYGYTPAGTDKRASISEALDSYNRIAREISQAAGVMFVDITDISRNDAVSMVASDDLHPSGYQYQLWVRRILESLEFRRFLVAQAP